MNFDRQGAVSPAKGFGEVLVAHLTREPDPPRTVNQNVPAELEAIVMRCLRKRGRRFQSMNDMQFALVDPMPHFQSFMQGQPAPRANGRCRCLAVDRW